MEFLYFFQDVSRCQGVAVESIKKILELINKNHLSWFFFCSLIYYLVP